MRKKVAIITFILVLVSNTVLSSVSPFKAIAKELEQSIFTNITITDEQGTVIDSNQNPDFQTDKDVPLNLNFDWSLKDMEGSIGDTYSYKLPSQVIPKAQNGKLLTSRNVDIGTYNVSTDGLVTITLNEEAVANHDGKLTIQANFNKEVIADNEKVSIPFTLKKQEKVIHISFQADTIPESEKVQQQVETEADKEEKAKAETEGTATEETQNKEVKSNFHTQVLNGGEKREPKPIEENIVKEGSLVLKKADGSVIQEGEMLDPEEDLKLEFEWTLPSGHEYIAGDTFKLQLPEQLKIYNEINGELTDGQTVFGTYKVTEDGNVLFTFNEHIEHNPNVNGRFYVETHLDEQKIIITEDILEFKVNDKVTDKVPINVKPKDGQAIAKSGQPVGGSFNADEIEWTVIVNTSRESLENAIIQDPILAGQELIVDSIKLKEVEVDLKGNVVKEKDNEVKFNNKSSEEKLELDLGNTNKAYKLTFRTKIKEDEKDKEGVTQYKNTAKLVSDNKNTAESGTSVSVERPKSLEKSSSAFNEKDRSVEWTVHANFNEKELKTGETITDEFTFTVGDKTLNDAFEFQNIEIMQIDSFNNDGSIGNTSIAPEDLFDIKIVGNKVTYTLKKDTNKAFIFKYKSKAKDGAYITNDGKITNEVSLNGKTAESSQGVYQQVGKKEHGQINYKDKTIDWTITVNADEQDLRNFILTDKFPGSGQKLVPDSISISPENSNAKITVNDDEEGFVIDFGNITKKYTIKYKTKFTYDFGSEETKPNFTNGLHLSYETNDGKDHKLEIEDRVDPNNETKNNGVKNGKVDNETKEITWTVDINYNQLSLQDAKFIDKIAENQALVDGSVKVYKTTIDKNGGITVSEDVTENLAITTDNNEIQINLGKIDQSYRVEFITVDKDGIYNDDEIYENKAQFIPRDGETHNLEAHVSLPNQGEFLSKTGIHNKDDWTIDWTIEVNKSNSKLTDIIVTDDLGDESLQVLLEDTIKVTKVGSNEPLVAGKDYEITVNDNKFELKILGETSDTYIVKYSSYILAKDTTNITNNAEVKSNNEIVGTKTKVESVEVKISSGGGPTQGGTGELILEKVEAGSNKLLAGVAFVLKTTVGNKEIVVREGTTDTDGKLHWTGLKYGKYTLEEKVPEGYLAETPIEIKLVYAEMPEGVKTIKIVNKRQTGTAKIIKQDAVTKETLANATFKITNIETNQKFELTTNAEGVAEADVPFGEYKVEEIQAPKGYKIATELKNIKIEIGKLTEIIIDNDAIIDVSGEKKWIDGDAKNRPKSIKVQVLDGDTIVKEKEVTANDNWKYTFKDLPKYDENNKEINYTVKEVPVDGYISKVDGNNITNIELMDISGEKTWKDGNSEDRPDAIKVNLLRNGKIIDSKEVTADDYWKYSFKDLEKYDENGKAYKYTVKEQGVPGYKSEVDGFDITNIRSEKTSVEVTKSWLDDESKERPDSVTVILLQNEKEIKSVKVKASEGWKYEFTNLEAYDENGVAYKYTIKEKNVEGYESTVEGYDITNLRVGKTIVSGTKTWKDNNAEGNRPKSITVELLQNGKVIDSKEVTATDNWKYSFTDLDEFDKNGVAYKYSVQEQPIEGYQPTVKGYDITNVRVGKTYVEGKKTWKDDNSKDRPEMIKVNLLRNGVVIDTQEVTSKTDWKYSFTNLEKYDTEGKTYGYTVKEQGVPGYKSEVDGYDITNTRSDKTSVIVTKGWKDDNSKDRPKSITVNLLQNGKVINTVEIEASNDWTYEFTDLEGYDANGIAYKYTVEEKAIEGYKSTVDGYDITNLRVGKTSVEGSKTWKDDDFKDRPKMIKVDLLQNDKVIDTKEVTADTNWKYSFTDLEKYDEEGKAYVYSVKEHSVEGYESIVSGYDITNKLIYGDVELNKVDKDNHQQKLAGAEFTLQTKKGDIIQKGLKTNSKGKLEVSNLRPGDYKFIETKAPAGYVLNPEPIKFTIAVAQKEKLQITFENEKDDDKPTSNKPGNDPGSTPGNDSEKGKGNQTGTNTNNNSANSHYSLPNTATNMYTWLLIGVSLLIISSALLIFGRRKAE